MKRLLLVAIAGCSFAQTQACSDELLSRWNRFAADANAYIKGAVVDGVIDARLRSRLDREWKSVTNCECW